MLLAKTLKIVIFLRENAYFQEIEDKDQRKNNKKCAEKSHVFWNFDFINFPVGFGAGFGKPKHQKIKPGAPKMRFETDKN